MTPDFADAVDPVFVHTLGLVDRIEKGESLDARSEQEQICRRLERADAALGRTEEWTLARYAIVAWIDDLLINNLHPHWESGARWWKNNVLERREFGLAVRGTRFFENARETTHFPDRNALEVYYICVILGFRGVYEDPLKNAGIISEYNLPPSLEDWLADNANGIRLGRFPSIPNASDEGPRAPPLDGHAWRSISFIAFGVALIGFLLACAKVFLFNQSQ